MSVSPEDIERVRERANRACEYCGVTETDTGGSLTVDHHQPQSQGGSDSLDNLIYCCWRCNLHKAAYWPMSEQAPALWCPRNEPKERHFQLLADGRLLALTPTGEFTLQRLCLNRAPLVAHRQRKLARARQRELRQRSQALLLLLEETQRRHAEFLQQHRALVAEQRELLRLLEQEDE